VPVTGGQVDLVTAPWVRRARRSIYANRWIDVVEDDVELPNGHETIYGVVRCGPCVGVLPFVDDDNVVLVQQYRYVAGHPTWEMPTGGVNGGESLESAARRELAEEAGLSCGQLRAISRFHTSTSVVDETAHLYVARDLAPVTARPDDTELVRTAVRPFVEVLERVMTSDITDSMTVIAVLLAQRLRDHGLLWVTT
jgi:ADP-ribose pyrophosphatase